MLSYEEKKAIKLTKTIIEFAGDSYIPKENRKALQVLLNLIEKQQKEIEGLKENYIRLQNTEAIQDIYIKKDKIRELRAKIEDKLHVVTPSCSEIEKNK